VLGLVTFAGCITLVFIQSTQAYWACHPLWVGAVMAMVSATKVGKALLNLSAFLQSLKFFFVYLGGRDLM